MIDLEQGPDEELARWQREYTTWQPAPTVTVDQVLRTVRRKRTVAIAVRAASLAAVLLAGAVIVTLQATEDSTLAPVEGRTYEFTTPGCARLPVTCDQVVTRWLESVGLTSSEPVVHTDALTRAVPSGSFRYPHEKGTVILNVKLNEGTSEAPLVLSIVIAPTTTNGTNPAFTRSPFPDSVPVRLRNGTVATLTAATTTPEWQRVFQLWIPSRAGTHPAIDIAVGSANLSNAGGPPELPPSVTAEAITDLANRLLDGPG